MCVCRIRSLEEQERDIAKRVVTKGGGGKNWINFPAFAVGCSLRETLRLFFFVRGAHQVRLKFERKEKNE